MPQALATHQPTRIRNLAELLDQVELDDAARFARSFAEDIEKQTVTVLVTGEFKRGKSSLVNALIGEDLLPVDIVPTTAVTHVLHHGERGLAIHWRDGRREERPLTPDQLRHLASVEAGGSLSLEDIEFAEITLPNHRLENGLVLVDTPGTNDMSQMRSEVVYKMIPRADAVVFVLDGTTQLTATEKAFLTDKLMTSMAPPLCFVLNKMDRVDGEEQDEILEEAKVMLRQHLPVSDLTLVACSTKDRGVGIHALNRYIEAFLAGGERYLAADRKRERLVRELKALVQREVETRRQLGAQDIESLRQQLEATRKDASSLEHRWTRFRAYLQQAGPEALEPMVRQSFRHHCEELERRLQPQLATMPPQVLAKQLPMMVEDAFKGWLNRKTPEFHAFLERYRAAMLHEFGSNFSGWSIQTGSAPVNTFQDSPETFRIEGQVDVGEAELANISRFGIPGAGAIVGLFVLGPLGGIIGGLLGNLVAGEAQKAKTEEAQQRLASAIHDLLAQEGERFLQSVMGSIMSYMQQFADGLERAARTLSQEAQQRLQEAIRHAESSEVDRSASEQRMQRILSELENI